MPKPTLNWQVAKSEFKSGSDSDTTLLSHNTAGSRGAVLATHHLFGAEAQASLLAVLSGQPRESGRDICEEFYHWHLALIELKMLSIL